MKNACPDIVMSAAGVTKSMAIKEVRVDFSDFPTNEPMVSVGLGNFPDAEACRNYFGFGSSAGSEEMTCQWWSDLGVEWTEPDDEECSGYVWQPVPLELLLGSSFSYSDSFRDALFVACKSANIVQANLVLLLYNFVFSDQTGLRSPFMKFAGVLQYNPDS